jgi:hypothetical protein
MIPGCWDNDGEAAFLLEADLNDVPKRQKVSGYAQ